MGFSYQQFVCITRVIPLGNPQPSLFGAPPHSWVSSRHWGLYPAVDLLYPACYTSYRPTPPPPPQAHFTIIAFLSSTKGTSSSPLGQYYFR